MAFLWDFEEIHTRAWTWENPTGLTYGEVWLYFCECCNKQVIRVRAKNGPMPPIGDERAAADTGLPFIHASVPNDFLVARYVGKPFNTARARLANKCELALINEVQRLSRRPSALDIIYNLPDPVLGDTDEWITVNTVQDVVKLNRSPRSG